MKKICIVTATRAEYGCLKSLIDIVHKSNNFQLQLVVTGAHLVKSQGYTVKNIQDDGYPIASIVDVNVDNSSKESIAYSMSRYADHFTSEFNHLNPDVVVVLGDRYELLPICSTAFIMGIPIAHISGGDITEGALDDNIRNAVTMLAKYHFPGTVDSANNIIRMRGNNKNIFTVGEPTLDFYNFNILLTRDELAFDLSLDNKKKWMLFTYHPETTRNLNDNISTVKNIISVFNGLVDYQIIITKANMDYGGEEINFYLENVAKKNPDQFKLFASLGQLRYLSLMKQANLVIGNSSSGIIETPFLKIPAVNVGNRQKGRYLCKNIIQSDCDFNSIKSSIEKAITLDDSQFDDSTYWGEGEVANQIYKHLIHLLN